MSGVVERPTFMEISWQDTVTGRPGYVVVDRLVRGVASGGLRARAGLTLSEVRGLAKGMTLKEGLHYRPGDRYVPMGGAKGGIDCDPSDPELPGMLERFARAMRPILQTYWATGEDLGLSQDRIDAAFRSVGLGGSIDCVDRLLEDGDDSRARMQKAFDVDVEGVGLGELVGGCGVAQAALVALRHRGIDPAGARAVVQGYGSMGGATARYLARAGVRVVGIADVHGVVTNPDGLDTEELLLTRTAIGGLDRTHLRPDDRELPRDAWLDIPCDVLVPAAASYVITSDNVDRIRAAVVAEAANMPVLPTAEASLTNRGVTVVPDFVANSMTNAWWWWTLFGDVEPEAASALAKVQDSMSTLVDQLFDRVERSGGTLREAAHLITTTHWDEIERHYPTFEA